MEKEQHSSQTRDTAVVVASITGLHSSATDGDPVFFAEALQRCHEIMESVVSLYGGAMNPLTGELLTAYFGLVENSPDNSINAVNATLELYGRIDNMIAGHELPEGTGFRAGIAVGEAVLMVTGSGKARQNAIIGSPVDLASRIQDLAEPGQILAGPEIYRQTNSRFEYRALEPMPVKGYKQPVPIYELLGKKKEKRGISTESLRMITSAMVGREQESKILEGQIKQLLNGRGSVISIEGAAGIGKSRLIAEIRSLEITGNVLFLEGKGLSDGKNLSFHPIIQIIKSWAGITDEDNPAVSFRKLSGSIQGICQEHTAEILPFIATMMGFILDGETSQRLKGIEGEALEKLILKNMRDLLSRAASLRPVIIMVEDAHWADQTSVLFIESLFRLVKNHRLMFINIFRPGFKETGDRLKAFVKENLPEHGREIILKPLLEEESFELISNLLNRTALPEDIRELIVKRSEGNPFFIEEVIRSFIDEGIVEVKDKKFVTTEQIKYANIPETIDKVILSRIERLDEKTKSLLKTASVIGRNFYYKVLEEAAHTIEELDTRLEYLKETQLLSESRHKEDLEFLFKHALAQQATYDSILQKTKKELHLKIARSIEKVFAEKIHEFYGILAMHYGKAEVQEKKTEYLVKAGDEAFRSGASNEAMNFYMDAIRDLSPGKENSEDYYRYRDLENKIGFAQQAAGNNVEAIETFERIIEKYYGYRFPANELSEKIRGISNMIGFIYRVYFPYFNYKKEPDEEFNKYIRLLTQWGEALSTINPRRFILVSFSFLRRMLVYDLSKSVPGLSLFAECPAFFMWSGISLTISKKILDVTKKMGVENHPSSMVDYRYDLKMHDFHAGKLEEERDTDHVFNTGMRVGDFWPTTIYSVYSGYVNIELGHYQQFLKWAGRLEEISESFDNSHARAQMYRVLAVGNYKFRKIGETEEALEEGIPYTSKTGHFTPLLVLWTMKSRLHADRDEVDKAVKALSEADKLLEDKKIITNYHIHYLQAAAAVGFAKMRAGLAGGGLKKTDIQALFKIINRMIRLAGKMKVALVDAYCLKALVLWKLKKQHSAFRYFLLAVKAGQKYHCNLELSRVYFEAGRCLREPGAVKGMLMGISGSEYLLRARSMFEEMDLKEDLEEMERYMEG